MSRILLLINKRANQQLLKAWLGSRHEVIVGDEALGLQGPFDLCIIDGPILERCRKEVQERRERELPVFLPFLLVTTRNDVNLTSHQLWQSIEDLVTLPVQKLELMARVEVLLHAGELSRQNHRHAKILEMIAQKAPLPLVLQSVGQFVEQESRSTRQSRCSDRREQGVVDVAANLSLVAMEQHRYVQLRQQQLAYLAEGLADGLVAVDRQGRILAVNPAGRHLLQATSEIQPGQPATQALPGALVERLITVAENESGAQSLHLVMGETELSVLVSALPWERGSGGAIALIRDVTEEARYRRLQAGFIANTSHELRAPLAAISAALEAVLDGVIPPQEQKRYIRGLVDEVMRLRRLSEDIIGLSKLDHGLAELQPVSFDLDLIMESVELIWNSRSRQSGVSLHVEAEPVRVFADYDRVEQVIGNLLENALRHTAAGGSVTLSTRREAGMARIALTDTGLGIAAEHLPFLWDRFYKVDRSRSKANGGGSGLGLSIVRELVEQMGGNVFVDSAPGTGSTFGFTLPLAR